MLEKVVNLWISNTDSNDYISEDIGSISIDHIYINEILKNSKQFYDFKTFSWYVDSVLAGVVKLVYHKIINVYKSGSTLSNTIIEKIKTIQTNINDSKHILPSFMVNGFQLLNDYLEKKYNTQLESSLTNFIQNSKELSDIKLQSISTNDKNYLITILDKLLDHFENIKCSRQYFKWLNNDYERNKFIKKVKTTSIPLDDKSCTFILKIYGLCYKAQLLINDLNNSILAANKDAIGKQVWEVLRVIKHYLFLVIKKIITLPILRKIAFNIFVVLINLQETQLDFHMQRVLNYIMTELNDYGLEYCITDNTNFLLSNQTNLIYFDDKDIFNKDMEDFLKDNLEKYNVRDLNFSCDINIKDYQFINIRYFYDNYVKSSSLELYQNVKIQWKGNPEFLSNIFKQIIEFILNPLQLYTLFDLYFKTYIAVIYSEIKKVVEATSSTLENIKTSFQCYIQIYLILSWTIFPVNCTF